MRLSFFRLLLAIVARARTQRKHTTVVFTLGFAAILMVSGDSANAEPPSKDYVLKFYDNFRDKGLNQQKWSTYHVCWNVRSIPQVGHEQLYVEKGYNGLTVNPHKLKRGILRLVANSSPDESKTDGYPYYSGMISTEKSYNALYGYYEARLRVPKGQGLWPAIWMIPSDCGDHLPEIDVLEVLGHQTNVIYQYPHPDGGDSNVEQISGGTTHTNLVDAANDFHTYGLEWTKDYIAWSVDGKETQRVKNFAFEPHYYIISFAVGGYWPGNPDSSTPFPSSIDIDYVHIYSKK